MDRYELAGLVSVQVRMDPEDAGLAQVRRQMDPFLPGSSEATGLPLLVIDRTEARPLAAAAERHGPAGDPLVTQWDGRSLHLVHGERRCTVPAPLAGGDTAIHLEPGFPIAKAFRVVRPVLQQVLHRSGAVAVHAACVELDGSAIVIAGWSESGKTETALALCEGGARFVSDKWTVLGPDGRASAFPVNVGLRRWVVPYLPQLRSSLTTAPRLRLAAAGAWDALTAPVHGRRWQGPSAQAIGGALQTIGGLADRIALLPSAVRQVYSSETGEPVLPVRAVVLLRTVEEDRVVLREVGASYAGKRLAISAAYERRPWSALQQRLAYGTGGDSRPDDGVDHEQHLLQALLDPLPLFEVDAPFPTDPRRVAEAIIASLPRLCGE